MTTPRLERRDSQRYVAIPVEATLKEWNDVNALVPELFGWIEQNGLTLAGAPFYRYRVIGDEERNFSLEVGIPIDANVTGDGRVIPDSKPAGTYAVYVHTGHPDRLEESFRLMDDWAEGEGIAWDIDRSGERDVWRARFESFLTNPEEEPDLNKWSIEVAYLVDDTEDEDGTPLPRGIGNPATQALAVEGITTLEQVSRTREKDLLALHGVGPKAVRVLREALAEQGLSFS